MRVTGTTTARLSKSESNKHRRSGARVLSALALSAAVGLGGVFGTATASAEPGRGAIITFAGDKIEASLTKTQIDFYPALDSNPATREWFLNGTIGYKVVGPQAGAFNGTISLGYQVGFPGTVDGNISVSWSTPSLTFNSNPGVDNPNPLTFQAQLIPQGTGNLNVAMGPGIIDVPVASSNVTGSVGAVRLQGFHGTVRGVVGRINIRPYVKLVSSKGDTVIAYGKIWSS